MGALTLLLGPVPLAAQDGCLFGNGGRNDVASQAGPGITNIGGPHFICEGGVQIWADSAVVYSSEGMSHLIGAVRYLDQSRELRADEARYFTDLGRLQAQGHMSIRDEADGSRIDDGDLVYLRVTDFRDVETMTVTTGEDGRRPQAVLPPPPPDSVGTPSGPGEPYTVVADRIFLRGDAYFSASGEVDITRDSLFAFADSAEYDQEVGQLYLTGSARVESASTELLGREITMATLEAAETEIRALRDAKLTGDDLLLTSAQILVYLRDNTMQRLVATPIANEGEPVADSVDLARPVALVQDFELTADSLEVTASDDVIERVFAAGRARSVSTSRDSLNVEMLPQIARSDWLEGDTVVVTFKPADQTALAYGLEMEAPSEVAEREGGTDRYEVESVVARVGARSLYRLSPSDTMSVPGTDPPAVHYVLGDEITIRMRDGQDDGMEVVGQTRGIHLEPLARRAAPDSATDTLDLAADTSAVVRDTVRESARQDPSMSRPGHPSSDSNDPTPADRTAPRKEEPWRRP